jgi:subtilisin family serine protease
VAAVERRGGRTPIVVGALNANGTKSSYGTTGSGLWISAPGGEFGKSSTYFPGDPDPNAYKPAVLTTARTGCANSLEPTPVNALDAKGANPLAPNCQYTALMNGTSSATPNVSGVVALMLEANPQLTWRDVRHILARTAKKVDPAFAGRSATDIVPAQTVVLEQGWVTNAAGWSFSNWYGFGAVDAGAAVAMAKTYTTYLPPLQDAKQYLVVASGPYTVPPLSTAGLPVTFTVSESFSTVEFVTVFVNVLQTPIAGCNQIELTSPSGTKSILLNAANGFQNVALPNVRFLSNAFYGEPINGTWTLRFFDYCGVAISTSLSATQPQVLLLSGH